MKSKHINIYQTSLSNLGNYYKILKFFINFLRGATTYADMAREGVGENADIEWQRGEGGLVNADIG